MKRFTNSNYSNNQFLSLCPPVLSAFQKKLLPIQWVRKCGVTPKRVGRPGASSLPACWNIGKTVTEKQEANGWGTSVIEKLAKDLQNAFPGIEGFSRTNIFRMRAFYLAYEKTPQAVGQFDDLPVFRIPWGHNALLLEKTKKTDSRLWYAKKTIEHG